MAFHIVRYSNAAYHDFHEQSFPTQKDAVEFAEKIGDRYRYIWLLEYGIYKAGTKKVTSYIYYWSQAVTETDWGECPDARWGRPGGRKHLVEYEPLHYKSSKYAHLNVRATPTGRVVEATSSRTECVPAILDKTMHSPMSTQIVGS